MSVDAKIPSNAACCIGLATAVKAGRGCVRPGSARRQPLHSRNASIANDLGFAESTVPALLGHAQGTVTSRYIHSIDTALIMGADTIAGHIQRLLDGAQFKRMTYTPDRAARRTALDRLLKNNLAGHSEFKPRLVA